MARLTACFSLLFILLTLLANPTFGSDPTYKDCKPHIDATILDLAAKAVKAGEQPSEPAEQPEPCPGSEEKEVISEPPIPELEKKVDIAGEQEPEPIPEEAPAEQASLPLPVEEETPPTPPVQQAPPPPVQQTPPPVQKTPTPQKKVSPTPSPGPSTEEKLSGFDKFMYLVFSYRPQPRDPKYIQPWQTFPEFRKSPADPKEKQKIKPATPGMISNFMNKFIGMIFKVSDEPRDPKWREPWQTHKEYVKEKKPTEIPAKPKEIPKSLIDVSFFNKIVQIIFGVDTSTSRDAKWSKPWNSHDEYKKKEQRKEEKVPQKFVHVPKKGGIINFIVSLIFEVPSGERDPKWLQPWTTHKGFQKVDKKVETEGPVVKKVSEPGIFSRYMNKFVYLIFAEPVGPRDPKYAQPWNLHKEVKVEKVKVEVKPQESNFLGIKTAFNKLIQLTFGSSVTTRDPKWAKPWQPAKKGEKEPSEARKAAPPPQEAAPAPPPPPAAAPAPPPPAAAAPAPPPPAAAPAPPPPPPAAVPSPSQPSPSLPKEAFPSDTEAKDSKKETPKPTKQIKKSNETVKAKEGKKGKEKKVMTKATFEKVEKKTKEDIKLEKEKIVKSKAKISKDAADSKLKKSSEKEKKDSSTKEKDKGKKRKSLEKISKKKAPKDDSKKKSEKQETKRKDTPVKSKTKRDKISTKTQKKKSQVPKPPIKESKKQPVKTKEAKKKKEVQKKGQQKREIKKSHKKKEIKKKDTKQKEVKKKKPQKKKIKRKETKSKDAKTKSQRSERRPKTHKKPKLKKPSKVSDSARDKKNKLTKSKTPEKGKSKPDKRTETKTKSNLGVGKVGAKPGPPPADEQVARPPKAPVVQEREPKKEKIIEDQEQIVVVPSALRARDHIESILGLDEAARLSSARTDPIADATLRDLKQIHETAVKPLELTYKYQDISNRHLSDAELFGTPLVLLLGPYSTGKSTFINYLLGIEFTKKALKTGTPPSHGVFRIVKYGEQDREVDGTDLSGHWSFGSLQKFGQNFVDQIRGKELNSPLLKKVTFVEAPGILEMRRPGERLYPFNDVVQWFIDRADLILVMFDYTKLDAGYELEAILDQLKGREAQSRILLNKADQVPPEELIKVQGSLFWNLSPLLGVSAPPTVYAGSFASLPYRPSSPVKLFQAQEEALLHDIARAINSRVDNRIAIARRHAVRVRNHAQMVDTYLTTFYRNKGFLTSKHKLAEEIIENPHAYNIYEGVSLLTNISRYDLPDAEVYRDFFRIHNLYNFRTLRETCSYLAGCPLDKLDAAINKQLPELMARYRRLVEAASPAAKLPDANIRSGGLGAGVAHAHHSKS